ncbi:MAG TPA: nucleotide exchange factor GrpE [Nitrospiraceae bacterium]|nr:nucleotide exchange factor GrpE [Nitrospiraceae bacterium]
MTEQDHNANTIDNLAQDSLGTDEVSGDPAGSLEDLRRSLETKEAECRNAHDKYLRLAAEFDNFKRISQRDQRDQIKFGNEQLLKELLVVADNLDRAIKSAKDAATDANDHGGNNALVQGVELTLKQFLAVLTRFGVSPVESVGKPFDPATQQAVGQVESATVPENAVVEEFQKGYLLHDRILRAAMVSVSKGAPAAEA